MSAWLWSSASLSRSALTSATSAPISIGLRASLLGIAVTGQRVSEGILKLPQPGLIIFPLLKALAVDRLAHLLRARGAHAALSLVELHALRLKVQSTELEQAPHAAL